jgi:hypothetical protein
MREKGGVMGSPKVKRSVKSEETAEETAERLDAGDDVFTEDEVKAATWKVNVEFPRWMVEELDKMSARLAVPRQAMIKMLVDEGIRTRRKEEKVS